MNRLNIVRGLILISVSALYAQEEPPIPLVEDKLMMAIEASNPVEVGRFLIPGYGTDQKDRYVVKAREMTNQTFMDLSNSEWSDVKNLLTGIIKCSAAALFGYVGYSYHQGIFEVNMWKTADGETAPKWHAPVKEGPYAFCNFFYGVLGVSALYSLKEGLADFWSIYQRTERLETHHRALIVEALIQRLPEYTKGHCKEDISALQ